MGISIEVAKNEIRENILSKKILIILGILIIISLNIIPAGIEDYNLWLSGYSDHNSTEQSWRWRAITALQERIDYAEQNGDSGATVQDLEEQIQILSKPIMPSVVVVFKSSILYYVVIGAVLGVALGFDTILREKKNGTLKQIFSAPLYRDEFIIGKVVGAIGTISLSFIIVIMLTIAILLWNSIIPDIEDILRIIMYFTSIILYCTFFYAVAMTTSLIVKNSGLSITLSVCIIIVLFIIAVISPIAANIVAIKICGDQPMETIDAENANQVTNTVNPGEALAPTVSPGYATYFERTKQYEEKVNRISELVTVISPINNLIGNFDATPDGIAFAVLSRQKYELHNYIVEILPITVPITLWDTITLVWYRVLMLLVECIAILFLGYTLIMRMDA